MCYLWFYLFAKSTTSIHVTHLVSITISHFLWTVLALIPSCLVTRKNINREIGKILLFSAVPVIKKSSFMTLYCYYKWSVLVKTTKLNLIKCTSTIFLGEHSRACTKRTFLHIFWCRELKKKINIKTYHELLFPTPDYGTTINVTKFRIYWNLLFNKL